MGRSDKDASFVSNVSDTSYTESYDILKSILSAPEHKAPSVTFSDDVAFTKDVTEDELFFDIPELDTRKFENSNGLSTYPAVVPFGLNYIYPTTHHLISSSSSIYNIIPAAYTIASLVRYYINGLSGRKRPVDVKKLRKFSLIKLDNIVMDTLEATTQLVGFSQSLPTRSSKNCSPTAGLTDMRMKPLTPSSIQ